MAQNSLGKQFSRPIMQNIDYNELNNACFEFAKRMHLKCPYHTKVCDVVHILTNLTYS